MIDIWMIFTMMYPFTGVVLQSYIQVTLFEPLSNVVTLPQSRKYHVDLLVFEEVSRLGRGHCILQKR